MKKYLLLLISLLVYGALAAQRLDSAQVVEKAKIYFKEVYVENNFKDPYSYELLKVIAQPYTAKDKAKLELSAAEELDLGGDPVGAYRELTLDYKTKLDKLKGKDGKVSKRNQAEYDRVEKYYLQALADYEVAVKSETGKASKLDSLRAIIESRDANTIRINEYRIEIHCYAANSLGNKVLGKYAFFIDVFGKPVSEPTKIN